MFRWIKIRDYERGLLYRDGVFVRMLRPGWRPVFDVLAKSTVQRVSVRDTFLESRDLDVIVRS
ncbi:MAG TPA: hypothetical protein VIV65_07860, partial [Gemmatimonadaceae bacterium]